MKCFIAVVLHVYVCVVVWCACIYVHVYIYVIYMHIMCVYVYMSTLYEGACVCAWRPVLMLGVFLDHSLL